MATIERYETKTKGTLWRVRYRTPDRTQTMERGFRTKRDAKEWWSITEESMRKGEFVPKAAGLVSLGEISELWFDTKAHRKATTRNNYRQALDKHVLPKWGERQISSITYGQVQAWINDMSSTLAASSVRPPYIALTGIFKYAIRDGRVSKSPCDGVELPSMTKSAHAYLTHQQVKFLASKTQSYGDVILFLALTGLRLGEMAALRVRDVDFAKRRINVERAVSDVRGELVWDTPKANERRKVPMAQTLADVLHRHTKGKALDDLVFTAPEGGVLRHANFRQRYFNKAVKLAMSADPLFPRLTPHDLRHTAASLAVSAGANVKAIQRMLGHKDASVTLNTYADLFEDDLDLLADALDAAHSKAA